MGRKCNLFFGTVLIVACMFLGSAKTAAAAVNLSDIDSHWARQEITEMYCSGIVAGYPEGVFLPGNDVTRLEVVAMLLRVMGFDSQARNMEKAPVDYTIPPVNWGRGYLIVGVQQGMLDKDYLVQLRPAEPASRAEVAVLMYHALKLEESNSQLTFLDAGDIPADYQSCVAAVVRRGLMQGMPGNLFMPNDAINRGQMATILSRILALNYGDKDIQSKRLSGIITEIAEADPNSVVLTINNNYDRLTAANCVVFLEGRASTLKQLRVDHRVKMVLNDDGLISFIAASTSDITDPNNNEVTISSNNEYKGKFDRITQVNNENWFSITTLDGSSLSRQIPAGLKAMDIDGWDINLQEINRGDYVQIKISAEKITEVKLIAPDTIRGEVTSVKTGSFTVRQDNGRDVNLEVTANTQIVKNSRTATYSDLQKEDRVQVLSLNTTALRVDVLGSPSVKGTIKEISTGNTTVLTIEDENYFTRDYVVMADAEVMQGSTRLRIRDLREWDSVWLELNSAGRVIYIEIVDMDNKVSKLTGVIREMSVGNTFRISIRNDNWETLDYIVENDVEVRRDGTFINFRSLNTGDRVRLELNSRDRVNYIEVVMGEQDVMRGIMADLIIGNTPQLFLERSNGKTERYYISDRATITRDGDNMRLRDLVIGSEIEISLDRGDIRSIKILDDKYIDVAGTVTSVNTSTRRLTIKQASGNEFTYQLDASAVIRDEVNRTINFGDVREGWKVILLLSDGRISRLTRE